MNSKRAKSLGFFIPILLLSTLLTSCGGNDMKSEKAIPDFSTFIENENLDDVSLKIYYINPFILTRAPLSIDGLIGHSAVQKIIIDGNSLKDHIDFFSQINADVLTPVKKKSHLNARLCYVLETEKDGKILEVAMNGNDNSIFVNGLEIKDSVIFYDVIEPFLTENAIKELEVYFNRGCQE